MKILLLSSVLSFTVGCTTLPSKSTESPLKYESTAAIMQYLYEERDIQAAIMPDDNQQPSVFVCGFEKGELQEGCWNWSLISLLPNSGGKKNESI